MKNIYFLIILVLLSGCAGTPTSQELASADYGQPMTQKECESQVINIMNTHLFDPGSAQYSFGNCTKMGFPSIPIMGLPKQYGYGLTVGINAKNIFGFYTGKRPHMFLFNDGVVIRKTQPGAAGQIPF